MFFHSTFTLHRLTLPKTVSQTSIISNPSHTLVLRPLIPDFRFNQPVYCAECALYVAASHCTVPNAPGIISWNHIVRDITKQDIIISGTIIAETLIAETLIAETIIAETIDSGNISTDNIISGINSAVHSGKIFPSRRNQLRMAMAGSSGCRLLKFRIHCRPSVLAALRPVR